MISIARTDSKHPGFVALVSQLDAYLAQIDGDETPFYSQHNKIDCLNHCVVAYEDDSPIACGALKEFNSTAMEIKRMFTLDSARGKGVATRILEELEAWTVELGFTHCVLETGKRQPAAVALYLKSGYQQIDNFEPYIGIENSVCFEKQV